MSDPTPTPGFDPGRRVRMDYWSEGDPLGTITRPWNGAKGDEGWYVQWDGAGETAEFEEDLEIVTPEDPRV